MSSSARPTRTSCREKIFDQALHESRGRQDAAGPRVEALANRITEIEARDAGSRNRAADYKSTIAILASSAIGIVAVLVAVFGR